MYIHVLKVNVTLFKFNVLLIYLIRHIDKVRSSILMVVNFYRDL
jgi:hypothetical protein